MSTLEATNLLAGLNVCGRGETHSMADTYTLQTSDPYYTGTVLHPGEDIDFTICEDGSVRTTMIDFPPSEDSTEWERLADTALAEAGWDRVAEWGDSGTLVSPTRQ